MPLCYFLHLNRIKGETPKRQRTKGNAEKKTKGKKMSEWVQTCVKYKNDSSLYYTFWLIGVWCEMWRCWCQCLLLCIQPINPMRNLTVCRYTFFPTFECKQGANYDLEFIRMAAGQSTEYISFLLRFIFFHVIIFKRYEIFSLAERKIVVFVSSFSLGLFNINLSIIHVKLKRNNGD